jgi:hypothetical protein
MRKATRILTVLALALAGTLAVATPASADPSGPHYWMYTDDSRNGGRVDFWSNGDHVLLCDIEADGRSANLRVADASNAFITLYYLKASGNGVCDAAHASDGGTHNLPEGHCIWFQIFLTDNGDFVSGSGDTAQWANDNEFAYNCKV